MYYLLMPDLEHRSRFIERMKAAGVACVFHYIPLHSSPAGRRFGRAHGDLVHTNRVSDCLVRMPLWLGLEQQLDEVFRAAQQALGASTG